MSTMKLSYVRNYVDKIQVFLKNNIRYLTGYEVRYILLKQII